MKTSAEGKPQEASDQRPWAQKKGQKNGSEGQKVFRHPTLIGTGVNAAGHVEGFVVVLPEPAAAAFACVAAVAPLRRPRRRPTAGA